MPDARGDNSPSFAKRTCDITSWQEGDISALSAREKKRYHKRKAAVEEYFTSKASLNELTLRHHLSSEILLKLARQCSMQHEDGNAWGFRALLPGVQVIDYVSQASGDPISAEQLTRVPDTARGTPTMDEGVVGENASGEDTARVPDTARGTPTMDGEPSGEPTEVADPTRVPVRGITCLPDEVPPMDEQAERDLEQTSILVEGAEEDTEVDTAKRQAVRLPNPTPVLMDVPETPFPLADVDGEDEEVSLLAEQEETDLPDENHTGENHTRVPTRDIPPMDEEARSVLSIHGEALDSIGDSSEEVSEDEIPTGRLEEVSSEQPFALTEEEITATDDVPVEEITEEETIDADDVPAEDMAEVPTGRLEHVTDGEQSEASSAAEQASLPEQPRGTLSEEQHIQPGMGEVSTSENGTDENTTRVPDSTRVPARGTPTMDEEVGTGDDGGAEGVTLSSEAEQAIAEVERILVGHKQSQGEDDGDENDGGEDTVRLHPDVVRMRSRGRVTTPMRAVTTKVLPVVLPPGSATAALRPYASPLGRKTVQGRLVRKRWQRDTHGQNRHKRSLHVMTLAILAAMLLFVLVPVGAGVAAYAAYNNISGVAHDGLNHLLAVKSMFSASKSDPTAALTAPKLQQAQSEFQAAENDFLQLQQLVNRSDVQGAINQFAPQYGSKLGMAQSLIQVALDVSRMGDELSGVALIGANIIHGSPLATASAKPLLSVTDVEAIEGSMVHALYYINDIRAQMSRIAIKDLPFSDAQKTQLTSLLPLLPKAEAYITQAQGLISMVSWLLGVGQPRRFLIQTMDRAELRPGGGFTGQYGILQIADGRLTPPSLTDVTPLDYAGNGTEIGRQTPPGYSWMNFGNWGVRDSNLSGDFPTTAQMTMQVFQDEGGGPLDGDIAFTPVVIGNVLDVTGPIRVPGYNETITSKNLEERLHYYQQDYSAIAREKQISGNYSHTGRKAFTSELSKLLLDRVRHLPVRQLLNVMKSAVKSIQSRDLEIYFTNPAAEAWLVNQGYSGAIDTFSTHDGFMVTQSNISISKASQYVHSTFEDDVTLDAQGGATHTLTMTLNYQQTGPVYGNDTYADYIRIYAAKSAQLQSGSGFDSGHAICSPRAPVGTPPPGVPPPVSGCGGYGGAFGSARYCPNGDYALGFDGMLNRPWSVDSLGPPTELTSDLPGRAMWGGLTETPKNCISTITVSWYVPNAVKSVHGQPVYSILVQKQGGMVPTIVLNIDASAIKGLKSFKFTGDINADRLFTLVPPPAKK